MLALRIPHSAEVILGTVELHYHITVDLPSCAAVHLGLDSQSLRALLGKDIHTEVTGIWSCACRIAAVAEVLGHELLVFFRGHGNRPPCRHALSFGVYVHVPACCNAPADRGIARSHLDGYNGSKIAAGMQMDMRELLESKRDEILRIARAHGARNVRVFGSVARGEAAETSDIDFLVDFEPGASLLQHGAMIAELEELLGRKVDVAPEKMLKERVRDRILREAVSL